MVIPVEIKIFQQKVRLISGISARSLIIVESRKNVLGVPVDSILEDGAGNYVVVKVDENNMLIGENIKLALLAIRANKMRSFLTMLGIIIGISLVISITSIGDSARTLLTDQFSSFGKNRMIIYSDSELGNDEIRYEDLFQMQDIDNLKEKFKNTIAYIVPSVSGSSEVRVGRVKSTMIMNGVDQDYDVYQNIEMLHGRMISRQDAASRRNRIVIDEEGALKLFKRTEALSRKLYRGRVQTSIWS